IITDGSKELLTGCSCGGRFFFYIKEEKLKEILAHIDEEPVLSKSEKKQIEEDVREIAGVTNEETPVFLDFESVKILKPGKYVIDLQKLFAEDKPKIYKLEDGKYIIDLVPLTKSKKTTS
ncbi:MAG: Zn-ribbon containing protein, partial [archaeon]